MIRPKVLVGECSIHIEDRGILLMTIPHRMWESRVNEFGEIRWSGESRGDTTTLSLVSYLQENIRGCGDRNDLSTRLGEVLEELRSPVWMKTFREEQIEKRKKRQERDVEERASDPGKTATVERRNGQEAEGLEAALEQVEWSRAA
jgi:predicted lipid-binding transport protein (Tim44 family)